MREVKRNNLHIHILFPFKKIQFYFGPLAAQVLSLMNTKAKKTIFCPLNDWSIKLGYSVPETILCHTSLFP